MFLCYAPAIFPRPIPLLTYWTLKGKTGEASLTIYTDGERPPCEGEHLRLGPIFPYGGNYAQYAYFIPPYEKYHPVFYAFLSKGLWKADLRIEPPEWVVYPVPEWTGRLLTSTY